ncbi:MAG: SDR family NAD(P)-dependent oxidoreductase, partial [Verrucomicrobiota bacterium]
REKGVPHVFDSRSLNFVDEIKKITRGRGVDAVLNSLAGEYLIKSLSLLAPFGRFLEIGKVDIYANRKLAMKAMRENVSYFVVDMAQILDARPEDARSLLDEVREEFRSGNYKAIPFQEFPASQVEDAFRFMAAGSHIGKVVVNMVDAEIPILPSLKNPRLIHDNRSYVIAGGADGFGLQIAAWLVSEGARHLALLSRSGPKSEASRETIAEMEAMGAKVLDLRSDVRDPDSVNDAFSLIDSKLPPIAGVVHCAMVVDDGMISELSPDRFRKALDPKMLGAWNLHLATKDRDLDHFICFSSFAGIVGGLRQSNYNAGNVFLDELAHYRRAIGLPALSINWGPLVGAGYLDRNEKTKQYMEAVQATPFTSEEAMKILHRVLQIDLPQVMAARVDWRTVHRIAPGVGTLDFFEEVRGDLDSGDLSGSIRPLLFAAPEDQQEHILEDFLVSQIAAVFGAKRDTLDRDTPVTQLGLDSLMSVELVNRLERNLGIPFPLANILNGPNIRDLASSILEAVLASETDSPESSGSTPAQS